MVRYARRKKTYTKYRGRAAATTKALRLARVALNRVPRALERKQKPWSTSSGVGSSGTMFSLLPSFGKGTDNDQFVGNFVNLKTTTLRFMIRRTGATPAVYRIILFRYWEENGGSSPTATNILMNNNVLSLKNQDQTQDSTFIHDKVYDFSNVAFHAATSGNTDVQRYHKWTYDLEKSSKRPYKVNSGNSLESGGLYLYVVSTDNITITAEALTFYTDA